MGIGCRLVLIGLLVVGCAINYHVFTLQMYTTVPAGDAMAVWSLDGSVEIVEGPASVFNFHRRVERLPLHTAVPQEYLKVVFHNGTVRNLAGPSSVRFNPLLHKRIQAKTATTITAHEVLVTYVRDEDTGEVSRKIIRGPCTHVPSADEKLHEFVWHGSDPHHKEKKIKKGRIFSKLRTVPTQMYYDVADVRTSDDATVTIRLMIFFEITDLDLMLVTTHDPIGDFINAVSADMVCFASNRTYLELAHETEILNQLDSYPQLVRRADRIGYKINKVVYRGYEASRQLQQMHDDAIHARTKLRLQSETEKQAQEILDMKLEREMVRARAERAEAARRMEHELQLQRTSHHDALERAAAEHELEVKAQSAANSEKVRFMQLLSDMGVDMTQYLVAKNRVPDKVIRIETDDVTAASPYYDPWESDLPSLSNSTGASNATTTSARVRADGTSVPSSSSSSSSSSSTLTSQEEAARREYRRQALKYHPDKNPHHKKNGDVHLHLLDD